MQYASGILTGSSVITLLVVIIMWIRYRKKDSAEVGRTEANTFKTLSEAYQVKISAELAINGEWKKITDDLRAQILEERKECEKEIEQVRNHYNKKIENMQFEINLMKKEIESLQNKT